MRSGSRRNLSRDVPIRLLSVCASSHVTETGPEFADAEGPTLAWYRDVIKANWSKPSEVKTQFGSASVRQDGRVVFNIGGNKYRILVWINYPYRIIYIRCIGSHRQYDAIDAQTI
jgi:mRNA interferase HigB